MCLDEQERRCSTRNLEVIKERYTQNRQIAYVNPIPKKPVDEYINKYGQLVIRSLTVSFTATRVPNDFLIMCSFSVNAVYKYYNGSICTNIVTRQYQRTGSCLVW